MSATSPANVEEVFYPARRTDRRHRRECHRARRSARRQAVARSACWRCARKSWRHINERAEDEPLSRIPQRLVHDVRAVMPEDGIVCLDNGMYKIWFARNYRTQSPTRCCSTTRSPPWARDCPRRSRRACSTRTPRDGGVRRRRLHDEQPGARDRGAAEARSGRGDPRGFRLWHDPLEAGSRPFPRFRHDFWQSRFRRLCRSPMAVTVTGSRPPPAGADAGSGLCRAAGSTLSRCRSTTARTPACWWTSWAAGSPMSTSSERQGRSSRTSLRRSLRIFALKLAVDDQHDRWPDDRVLPQLRT